MPFTSTLRRPDGYMCVATPDGVVEHDTHRCPHCGAVFEMVKGSGRRRGFCMKCMGVTCGSEQCGTCIPLEAQLDHMEGRNTPYTGLIVDQFGRAIG